VKSFASEIKRFNRLVVLKSFPRATCWLKDRLSHRQQESRRKV
jgi:hypothetical protein